MKKIDAIVIHCSATKAGQNIKADTIRRWHLAKGWQDIGYNFVIDLDGTVEKGRPLSLSGAHTNTSGLSGLPYNTHSIGICYVGGLDASGNARDTRTLPQKESMHRLVAELVQQYPTIIEVIGHRDCSPDKNGDGVITSNEWLKACPCFDVRAEFPQFQKKGKK